MNMHKFKLLAVLAGSFFLISCGTISYKAYVLDADSYEGTILGPAPADDLSLGLCKPDEHSKGKCMVYFIGDFELFKQDYLRISQKLKECQSNGQNPGTATFEYRYYGIQTDSYDGFLRGPKPKNDVAFKACTPQVGQKAPCILLFTDEYIRLKSDYNVMIIDLDECERRPHRQITMPTQGM